MYKLGFIGAGNMAEAIIKGIVERTGYGNEYLYAYDVSKERLSDIQYLYKINIVSSNKELVEKSDLVFLAIKPQQAQDVLTEIKELDCLADKIFVSVMAGKTIAFIKSILGDKSRVIRTMPNTPALLSEGMIALSKSNEIQDNEFEEVVQLFNSIGETVIISEDKMDAVTAVSGSGPAYVYYFVEKFISSAFQIGLSYSEASMLVKQTLLGASRMLVETEEEPAILREKVTSPSGTTMAAIEVFENSKFQDIIDKAVKAARDRSKELSKF